jgi:hypothetical protein
MPSKWMPELTKLYENIMFYLQMTYKVILIGVCCIAIIHLTNKLTFIQCVPPFWQLWEGHIFLCNNKPQNKKPNEGISIMDENFKMHNEGITTTIMLETCK